MARNLSGKEARNDYFDKMPREVAEAFSVLDNEVTLLNYVWRMYLSLFRESPERVQLLNYCAGAFFGILQNSVLSDDLLLRVFRLIDKPRTGKRRNASIPTLLAASRASLPREVMRRIGDSYALLAKFGETLRTERNKRIAHTDLATNLARFDDPAAGPTVRDMRSAINTINAVMNDIAIFFLDSEMRYEPIIDRGGVDDLIFYLERGRKSSK
jgi:hypothetical protein